MQIEGLGSAIEEIAVRVVTASDVAELGAVKPVSFGSLARKHLLSETVQSEVNELHSSVYPKISLCPNLFGEQEVEENPYFSMNYNEVSKECSEYLCDYGVTPQAWSEGSLDQRTGMLKTAMRIMSKEFGLPEEWKDSIKPIIIYSKGNKAETICNIKHRSGGGIDIDDVPAIKVSMKSLSGDYFDVMHDIYREMVHVKQLASVDHISPTPATDPKIVDMIDYFDKKDHSIANDVDYLSSLYEAEAWAQALYFKDILLEVTENRSR